MGIEDVTFRTLFEPLDGGMNLFAGNRSIIFDAALVGFSRRLMLTLTGPGTMREMLLRLGFAQGWRAASEPGGGLPVAPAPDSLAETVQTLLTAMGIAHARLVPGAGVFDRRIALEQSCEAEEHLRHCGPSAQPVCWLACGFVSGYMTRATNRHVVCHEDECAAAGARSCCISIDVMAGAPCDTTVDPFSEEASRRLIEHYQQHDPPIELPTTDDEDVTDGTLLGIRSPRMRLLVTLARRAAPCDSTVLVMGESGVGKERLAQFIHRASLRVRAPFVAINCGALSTELLENELFGHRRGAFTGATEDRKGLFEAAHRGTVFLDEIGELPPSMQVKLLRVLQEREIRRLGDTHDIPIDVRVIAATNRDLQSDVAAGRFREDLYYRLNVLAFDVPPLRQRPDDLRALVDILLAKVASRLNRAVRGCTPRALERMMSYHWPGNVRELENALERACALTTRTHIDLEDLPARVRHEDARLVGRPHPFLRLRDVEREHILAALRRCDGNRRLAARVLGISQDTVYRRLRAYHTSDDDVDRA